MYVENGHVSSGIKDKCLLPSVGPAVQDVVSFAAGSRVESLFKIARQAGVARIRARLATVQPCVGTTVLR